MPAPQPPLTGPRLLLRPAPAGSVARYIAMARAKEVTVDSAMRWDKRAKSTHRIAIASASGPQTLTVPVAKPAAYHEARLDTVTVSPHGSWWRLHLTALESAYGRTPFFDYYIDRFRHLMAPDVAGRSVAWLCAAWDAAICPILYLPVPSYQAPSDATGWLDMRAEKPTSTCPPYWQVRGAESGFIPGMSILDLIFNLGPEAAIYLRQ